MAIQFQTFKKRIWTKYVKDGKKTPQFIGQLEKSRDHWDLFVEFKQSEAAKEWSRKNKINTDKK